MNYVSVRMKASLVAQRLKRLPPMQETPVRSMGSIPGSDPWVRSLGPIPGSGISPGEGNGNSLQYSCLENPIDRGAW